MFVCKEVWVTQLAQKTDFQVCVLTYGKATYITECSPRFRGFEKNCLHITQRLVRRAFQCANSSTEVLKPKASRWIHARLMASSVSVLFLLAWTSENSYRIALILRQYFFCFSAWSSPALGSWWNIAEKILPLER